MSHRDNGIILRRGESRSSFLLVIQVYLRVSEGVGAAPLPTPDRYHARTPCSQTATLRECTLALPHRLPPMPSLTWSSPLLPISSAQPISSLVSLLLYPLVASLVSPFSSLPHALQPYPKTDSLLNSSPHTPSLITEPTRFPVPPFPSLVSNPPSAPHLPQDTLPG